MKGKVAIVTGGTMGIGRAIADALHKQGVKVIVCARHACRIKHHCIKCDVTDRKQVDAMVKEIMKKYKRIDILVNNAGIYPFVPFDKMTEEQWTQVMDVNLKGTFHCTKAVLPHMKKRKSGNIINLASVAGTRLGIPALVHYCTTKAGISGFTKAAAVELAPFGIRVNAIAPGLIDTPGVNKGIDKKSQKLFIAGVPMKRAGKPKDIGEIAAFLASDKSSYMTGETVIVDGGMSIN